MPNMMNEINQPVDKSDKNAFEASELNATHQLIPLKQQIASLSQQVQARIAPVVNLSSKKVDYKALEELDNEFPNLITETNVLNELVKKLNAIKVIPIAVRYKNSKQKVPLTSFSFNLNKTRRKKHKRFFYEFEKALDNTYIIDAFPHEATLFKVAVIYQLFLDKHPIFRVIEMLIAIRKDDLPDRFEYIKKEGIRFEANYIEWGQQAYQEITNNNDKILKQRFEASYEKFKEIYLGLIKPKNDLDAFQFNELNLPHLPEVPKNSQLDEVAEHEVQQKNNVEGLPPKRLNRNYVMFSGDELTTLQFLIPNHPKKPDFIPTISGIALDKFMRACLSKHLGIEETKENELRTRIAAEQFILKSSDILNNASRAMRDDKIGKLIDPYQGYVSYKADPDNIFKEIKKLYEDYQRKKIIIQDCKLPRLELTEFFFDKAMGILEQDLTNRLENQETFRQRIIEIKNFKKLVKEIGPENINIFADEKEGKASFSVPKDDISVADQFEDKATKNAFTVSELNTKHQLIPLKQKIVSTNQQVQAKIAPVVDLVSKVDHKIFEELDSKFPNLITETNILVEQVKKLNTNKVIPIPVRYKNSKQKVPLTSFSSNLHKALRKKHKRFFYEFEKALDNTYIIDAFPDEATLFKVAVLYQLFLEQDPSPRVIEMLIAIRKNDLPDHLKYIKKEGIRLKANYIELGQQAYQEITDNSDKVLKQRFEASYKKFKEIYLGLIKPKNDLDAFQFNEVNFPFLPEVPKYSQLDEVAEHEVQQRSNRNYAMFSGDELTTLLFLIPNHKKKPDFIPSIGGIALDKFMRACLSKQISIKDTKETEQRKRIAAEQFIHEAFDILNKVLEAMQNNTLAKTPYQNVSYEADADNFFKEIKKLYEDYQRKKIITQDCNSSGTELTKAFFDKAIGMLEKSSANNLKTLYEKYQIKKKSTWFFKIKGLKSEYVDKRKQIKETFHQRIIEMESFKKLVEEIGVEKINISAGEEGKMCISMLKDTLINEGMASAGFSPIVSC